MKRLKIKSRKGLTITFFSLTMMLGFHAELSQAARKVGRIGGIQGTVLVDDQKAKNGGEIHQGAVIQTKEGKCTVFLGGEDVIHLDRNSKLRVNQYLNNQKEKQKKGNLELEYGKTRALVKEKEDENKEVRVKTKGAVMGVRGTHVYINSQQGAETGSQEFGVIEGEAELSLEGSSGGQNAGQRATSQKTITLKSQEVLNRSNQGGTQKIQANSEKMRSMATAGNPPPQEENIGQNIEEASPSEENVQSQEEAAQRFSETAESDLEAEFQESNDLLTLEEEEEDETDSEPELDPEADSVTPVEFDIAVEAYNP